MAGQPWKVGDFELMYYKCTSGVKKDIIVRRVPGPKLIIWRMFLAASSGGFPVTWLDQTTGQHACTAFLKCCARRNDRVTIENRNPCMVQQGLRMPEVNHIHVSHVSSPRYAFSGGYVCSAYGQVPY